jgi:hypothetical protein
VDIEGGRGVAGLEHDHVGGLGDQSAAARQDNGVVVYDEYLHERVPVFQVIV